MKLFYLNINKENTTMKIKDIKDKENLIIKIEVDNDGSETIYRMLDRYDRN